MASFTRRNFSKTVAALAGMNVLYKNSNAAAPAPQKKIKIGQIGTAHAHAAGKMEALLKFPDQFDVIGIAEPDEELWKRNKSKTEYSQLKRFSVKELLEREDLEAVAIETDVPDLLPYAEEALKAGKHIHLDKPPGRSLNKFQHVLKIAESRNLVLQMGYMFRYNPAFLFMLEVLKKGWLGDIFEIDGVMSKAMSPKSREIEGPSHGGAMMLLGCHLVDMLIAILGKPDRIAAYQRKTFPHIDDVYDNELAVFKYPKATCTIRSALVEVEGWERRQFVVCGAKGTIEIKPLEDPVLKLSLDEPRGQFSKGSQFVDLRNNGDRYDEQVLDFAQMIRGEKRADYSYEHDLVTQEAVLQASSVNFD